MPTSERPRPRALLLTPVIPSDAGNGLAMRAGVLLTGLSSSFSVDVVVPPAPPADPRGECFTRAAAQRLLILEDSPSDQVSEASALLATPQGRERALAVRPLPELSRSARRSWAQQIQQLADGAALVVVFRTYLAPLLDPILDDLARPAILIDADELDADNERLQGRSEEAEPHLRLERYYLPKVDHVLTSTAADAHVLAARNPGATVTAMPNAVRLPETTAEPTGESDFVFVGNLSHQPNVEGALWFCESVLPLLGQVSVAIVGSSPGPELKALTRDPRVTLVADPAEIRPAYAAARIAVIPLLNGGGNRLKLAEALAHGRPVVSTSIGARGQPWQGADRVAGVLIADEPEAFAAACRRFLSDPALASELGERGREAVTERASVDVIAPRIASVAQEAVLRRSASSNRPLLTAALIVRDEEAVLRECLDSLVGVADEIVIVDTGSTDSTVALANEFGARVLHREWTGDFGGPRNYGLGHASGHWILYIDADERVAPITRAALEHQLTRSSAMAMRVLLRPTVHATPYYEYRLWRNDPRIRFAGLMHEQVVDVIHAAAVEDGRPIGDWSAMLLEHVGYEGDQTHKHERNLPLLQAQLQRDPTNIYNWRHLARVLEGLGRPDEADAALEQATKLVSAQPVPTVDGGLAWAELVRMRHEQGQDVSELLTLGRTRWPEHWLIRWMDGVIAEQEGRLDDAEQCFRSLLAVDVETLPQAGIAYDARIFGEWAYASLGLVLLRTGRDEEAAAAYAEAERLAPEQLEYRIKRELAAARARRASA